MLQWKKGIEYTEEPPYAEIAKYERFNFLLHQYDIVEAQKMINSWSPEKREEMFRMVPMDSNGIVSMLGATLAEKAAEKAEEERLKAEGKPYTMSWNVGAIIIDHEKAMESPCIDPIIVVDLRPHALNPDHGYVLVIDGWHRLYRAREMGDEYVPGFWIREAADIRRIFDFEHWLWLQKPIKKFEVTILKCIDNGTVVVEARDEKDAREKARNRRPQKWFNQDDWHNGVTPEEDPELYTENTWTEIGHVWELDEEE
jgi:hypothetical protein